MVIVYSAIICAIYLFYINVFRKDK
jgi:hypothetical protein